MDKGQLPQKTNKLETNNPLFHGMPDIFLHIAWRVKKNDKTDFGFNSICMSLYCSVIYPNPTFIMSPSRIMKSINTPKISVLEFI